MKKVIFLLLILPLTGIGCNFNRKVEDPQIKIEKCKTEAKLASESREYVPIEEVNEVSKRYCGDRTPDETCADLAFKYLNDLSDSRKAAAYDQSYLECLSK